MTRIPWDPASDGCVYLLQSGDLCGRPEETEEQSIGVPLCRKHYGDVCIRARYAMEDARERDRHRMERRARLDDRIDRTRATVTHTARGWGFRVNLPQLEGGSKRRSQSGFATQQEARQVAKKLIEAQREPDHERRRRQEMKTEAAAAAKAKREAKTASAAADRRERRRERRDKERGRTVYYVQRPDGAIKIGTTWNIESRMGAFRNVAPCDLLAVHSGGQPAETALHRRFRSDRLDGEWFAATTELMAHIAHVVGVSEKRRNGIR